MSYRLSRARRAFDSHLKQMHADLSLLHPLTKKRRESGERLLAAYYVSAFAQLEVYVASLVEDALGAVTSAALTFEEWPDQMLAYFLHKSDELASDYRKFGENGDERAILRKVATMTKKVAGWQKGNAMPEQLSSGAFLNNRKYPSPKNLPRLFERLGVTDVWAVTNRAGKINAKMLLTSLNDLRTDIVHDGKLPPSFTYSDLRGRFGQMSQLVAALDRGVSRHFCSGVVPRAKWNTAMT